MEAQGYSKKLILAQDNMSTEKMEKNGRNSCGKRSRHIKIRNFWIKDYVDRGEIYIVHFPEEFMKADNLSKPLQGALFRKFRAEQMNIHDGKEQKADLKEALPSPRSVLEITSESRDDVRDISKTRSDLDGKNSNRFSPCYAQSMRSTNTSVGKLSWNNMLDHKK